MTAHSIITAHPEYTMINKLITEFEENRFSDISRLDPLILELEEHLLAHKQFLYIGDLIQLKLDFVSRNVRNLIGVSPVRFNLSTFINRAHPDDQLRYGHSKTKLIQMGHDLLLQRGGHAVISTDFRILNRLDRYVNMLFQSYLFYSELNNSVYAILILTDISEFQLSKHHFHYYKGSDNAYLRFPDVDLLNTGFDFTKRELEVLLLIGQGCQSNEIADKLSISFNTVNTHRRNLLKKTNNTDTHKLVMDLKNKGIL